MGGDQYPHDGVEFANLCNQHAAELRQLGITKAHYGCGSCLFGRGWVNIDRGTIPTNATEAFFSMDLLQCHPFPFEFFRFSFAEDFLEHLDQSESLIFLSEVFRTLRPERVLRLSFPGLPGVLRRHFRGTDWDGASVGQKEAYTMWDHKHFFCQESLILVARHLGFSDIRFVEYGKSVDDELRNLDSRLDQKDLNIYAELTK